MQILLLSAGAVILLLVAALAVALTKLAAFKEKVAEVDGLRALQAKHLEEKSIAVTKHQEIEARLAEAISNCTNALKEKEAATIAHRDADKQVALMKQSVAEMEKRIEQWQADQQKFTRMAETAVFEMGNKVSSKLLEDHKREAEAAKKEAETITKTVTERMFEQVTQITQKVASLHDQTAETKKKIGIVYRALSTPGGAGQLSEIGLENSLKNLGLEAGRDFIMQYAIPGDEERGALRPDALIFLPQDVVMVVDSKASKFTLEFAECEGTEQEKEALENLKRSMNTHLNALKSKDYASAIQNYYKTVGRAEKISQILSVMYLPNEAAVERLKHADAEFLSKVERAGLILAGPSSLAGLLSLATRSIVMARQADNHETILKTMQELMESVIVLLGHSDKVGKAMRSAAKGYEEYARSVNRGLLPKLRRLANLGMKPKNKEIPGRVEIYEVRSLDDILTLEAEEISEENTQVRLQLVDN